MDILRAFKEHFKESLVKAAAYGMEEMLRHLILGRLEKYEEEILKQTDPTEMAKMLVVLKTMAVCSGSWRTQLVNFFTTPVCDARKVVSFMLLRLH